MKFSTLERRGCVHSTLPELVYLQCDALDDNTRISSEGMNYLTPDIGYEETCEVRAQKATPVRFELTRAMHNR